MPSIYQFNEIQILTFALVLMRITAFVFVWPILGTQTIPIQIKILFSLVLTMVLSPTVLVSAPVQEEMSQVVIWLAAREITIGLFLGFVARMFLFAVAIGAQIASVSLGLAQAQLFNPSLGSQGNIIEQFQVTLASMVFLALGGHHYLLSGLASSFTMIPLSSVGINIDSFQTIIQMGQEVLVIGLKICAPVLVAIFLTNLSMGIIGRAVPQINVLVTSIPVTIMIGLITMIFTMPLFITEMDTLLQATVERMFQTMKVM